MKQTITKSEKEYSVQRLKFILDTYPDKIRLLKQELREYEMSVCDAKERLDEINKLEVV